MTRRRAVLGAVVVAIAATAVSAGALSRGPARGAVSAGCAGASRPEATLGYDVVRTTPHDPNAFTEGLLADHGAFYESTGLYGQSDVREVDIATGRVLRRTALDAGFFGEGLAELGDRLYQLTYRERTGFVYDRRDLRRVGQFSYRTEGWGLTAVGGRLVMSDGSSTLSAVDPATSAQTPFAQVTEKGAPLSGINDLQLIGGCIYANVYPTDRIVVIDPASGRVTASIDLTALRSDPKTQHRDVLNGIAYDPDDHAVYVTGKWWGAVYEIRLRPGPG